MSMLNMIHLNGLKIVEENLEKIHSGTKVCRFAQFPEGKAIMPSFLEELLASRKATRKLIPQQNDEFMKNILDKRQLVINYSQFIVWSMWC